MSACLSLRVPHRSTATQKWSLEYMPGTRQGRRALERSSSATLVGAIRHHSLVRSAILVGAIGDPYRCEQRSVSVRSSIRVGAITDPCRCNHQSSSVRLTSDSVRLSIHGLRPVARRVRPPSEPTALTSEAATAPTSDDPVAPTSVRGRAPTSEETDRTDQRSRDRTGRRRGCRLPQIEGGVR